MYCLPSCTFAKIVLFRCPLFNLIGINGALENCGEEFSLRKGLNLKLL